MKSHQTLSIVSALLWTWSCGGADNATVPCQDLEPPSGTVVTTDTEFPAGETVTAAVYYVSQIRDGDREFAQSLGGEIIYEFRGFYAAAVRMPGEAVFALLDHPRVQKVVVPDFYFDLASNGC